ncbi:SdpI family protein [Peribacillus butanolivorans]|uniref:SdpI family protein n=1 Tax=Peribacillus butanolivorans TaxID=421767 RepID=UPI0036D792C4
MEKRKTKSFLILTSILCLLPLVFSLFVLEKLPDKIPIQWNLDGEVNTYGNTVLVAIGLPLLFFILNILVHVIVDNDPSNIKQVIVIKKVVSFILSLVSIIIVPSILLSALDYTINIIDIAVILVSVILIFVGNYLPKTRQNYSMGIRMPWTLNDSENWKKTHRFTGYLWTITGYVLLQANLFFMLVYKNDPIKSTLLIITILIISVCPLSYSFLLYKKSKVQ